MFSKKTFIKVEFFEDRPLVTAHIDKNTNPDHVSYFINKLLVGDFVDPVLEVILRDSKKNNALSVGEEIVENVLSFQRGIDIRPTPPPGRNPIIRPSKVIKSEREDDE